jgi:hypothetical protein
MTAKLHWSKKYVSLDSQVCLERGGPTCTYVERHAFSNLNSQADLFVPDLLGSVAHQCARLAISKTGRSLNTVGEGIQEDASKSWSSKPVFKEGKCTLSIEELSEQLASVF